MNVPAGFVITNSNVLNSQKLRISTNGSHPKVISSALRKCKAGVEQDGLDGADYDNVDFDEYDDDVDEEVVEDNDYDILKYRNKRTMKKNNKFYSRRNKDNFYDEFDYEDF